METKHEKIKEIERALKNQKNMHPEELAEIVNSCIDFVKKLPENERGNFFWESGLECLVLLVEGSKFTKSIERQD